MSNVFFEVKKKNRVTRTNITSGILRIDDHNCSPSKP